MRLRNLVKRVETLEAFRARHDLVPSYALVRVVNAGHRRDPEDTDPVPAGVWSADLLAAGCLTVLRLPGEVDATFHARAAKLARSADPGMVPVLMPVWRPQQGSP